MTDITQNDHSATPVRLPFNDMTAVEQAAFLKWSSEVSKTWSRALSRGIKLVAQMSRNPNVTVGPLKHKGFVELGLAGLQGHGARAFVTSPRPTVWPSSVDDEVAKQLVMQADCIDRYMAEGITSLRGEVIPASKI